MIGRIIGAVVVMAALTACQTMIGNAQNQPLQSLAGTEWGFPNNPYNQFIAFNPNGEVNGNGGCNGFFGSFTQMGPQLTFGPIASTRRACQEPLNSAERGFFDVLNRTRTVNATNRELVLFGDRGEVLAVMTRRH